MTEAQGYDHTRLGAVLLAGAERPKPPSALRASLLFRQRALLKIWHVPEQLFDVTMFPILFTLMFISNIFVELSTMPGFLQGFVHVNPVTHVADVARSVMGGTAVDSSGPIALAWAVGFITIFGTLTMWRYNRKL